MAGWGSAYLRELERRPLRTKAVTAALLAAAADLIAQRLSKPRSAPYDTRKPLLMALWGLVYAGPSAHYFHRLLERLFAARKSCGRPADIWSAVQPLDDDVPFKNCRGWSQTGNKIRSDYAGIQKNGWRLWPIVAFINYKFMPLELRVLFINVVAIFWSTFMIMRSKSAVPVVTIRLPVKVA
eukprot:jgi/Chlat1/4236/Chrsp27S04313